MKILIGLSAITLATLAVPSAASDTVILDEDFGTGLGVFQTYGSVAIATGADYIPCCGATGSGAHLANPFLVFSPGDAQVGGQINATFDIVRGRQYSITYDYAFLGSGVDRLFSSIVDQFGFLTLNVSPEVGVGNNDFDTNFTTRTRNFIGYNTGTARLTFWANGTQGADAVLDDVRIVAAGVPEPASWAMMLIGFGALGGALRRRRGVARGRHAAA